MTSPSRHPNGQRLEKRFNVHLLTLPVDTMMLCDGGSEDWDLAKKLQRGTKTQHWNQLCFTATIKKIRLMNQDITITSLPNQTQDIHTLEMLRIKFRVNDLKFWLSVVKHPHTDFKLLNNLAKS